MNQLLLRRAPQRFRPRFRLQNATRLTTFHLASYLADFYDYSLSAPFRDTYLLSPYHLPFSPYLAGLEPNDYPLFLNHHCLAWTRSLELPALTTSPIGSGGFTDPSF